MAVFGFLGRGRGIYSIAFNDRAPQATDVSWETYYSDLLDSIASLNKLIFSPFFSLFRMFSSLTSKAPLDRI
jgi:hypothetical protein